MTRFLIRRAVTGLLVIWLISVIVFGLFFVAPHDVPQLLLGKFAAQNQQLVASVTHQLGLDQPLVVFVVAANVLVDLLYAILDPRIRLS